jgi:ABC-type multidrug transport system ATPase subunit
MTSAIAGLRDARRYYGKRLALSIDCLDIHEGDCLGIAGKNGAGKSTLMRVLAGITRLTSGAMQTSQAWNVAQIAYCPQSGGLYGDLTVQENIRCMIRRFSSPSSHGLYEELLKSTELGEINDVQVRKLSGGFQKLAMIGAAFAVSARVLILDEPTSDLHATYQAAVADLLSRAQPHYLAILLCDHSEDMLKTATRRVELTRP